MPASYADRLQLARRGLEALHHTRPMPPGHVIDQLEAAHTQAFATIRRIGDLEQHINPDRWWRTPETSTDTSRIIDIQARVMAAMGDGHRWPVCIDLRRTPYKPATCSSRSAASTANGAPPPSASHHPKTTIAATCAAPAASPRSGLCVSPSCHGSCSATHAGQCARELHPHKEVLSP